MAIKNTLHSYGFLAKLLHWVVALFIIGLLIVGTLMTDLQGAFKYKVYDIHKAFGIIVLALVFIRFFWMLLNPKPLLPETMKPHEKLAAKLGHYSLYGLMFFIPFSGWIMSNSAGYGVSIFGVVNVPAIAAKSDALKDLAKEAHEISTSIIIILLGVHVAAALFHHFIKKDNVLKRMLPTHS